MGKNELLEELSDDELIELSRNGNSDAEECLLSRYAPLVKKEIRYLYISGAETEDLSQEAMIGLVKAIRDYDISGNATFITYATVCVRNQIRSAITSSNRLKHQPLNTYVSFYSDVGNGVEGEESDIELIDVLTAKEESDPEYLFLLEEKRNALLDSIETRLSSMERKVARLYLEGMTYMDIAKTLGKNEQSVTNALSRARAKLRD